MITRWLCPLVRVALPSVLGILACSASAQEIVIEPDASYPPLLGQKSTPWSVSCPGKPHSESGFGTGNTCNAADKDAERQADACVQGIGHCAGYPVNIDIGDCTGSFAMSRNGCNRTLYEYKYAIFVNGECRGFITKRTSGGDEGNPDLHMCHVLCRMLPSFGCGARAVLCYKRCINPDGVTSMTPGSCVPYCNSCSPGRTRRPRCHRR